VLLRLAYLGVTNAFALLRLLPMSDRDKDVEILALRHQLAVLHRQLGTEKARFEASDRAILAALLHRLPRTVLRRVPVRLVNPVRGADVRVCARVAVPVRRRCRP
jgi:putative transposase